MRWPRILSCLVLCVCVAVPSEARAEERCASKSSIAERERCGSAQYAAGRYAAAAEVFESLWEETEAVKYLFNAGVAREAAGSDSWAFSHILQYLRATELTERERQEAERRKRQLQSRLVPVTIDIRPLKTLEPGARLHFRRTTENGVEEFSYLRSLLAGDGVLHVELAAGPWSVWVEPDSASPAYDQMAELVEFEAERERVVVVRLRPATARVTFRFGPPEEVRFGVEVRLQDPLGIEPEMSRRFFGPRERMTLRTGPWLVTARQRTMSPWLVTKRIEVGPETEFEFMWNPSREDIARRERQRKVIQGLAGGGASLLALGIIFLGVGLEREGAALRGPNEVTYVEQRSVKISQSLAAWGGGLAGGGLGAGIAAGLERMEPTTTRKALTFASGGSVALIGLIWHAAAFGAYSDARKEGFSGEDGADGMVSAESVRGKGVLAAVSAGLFGLGMGVIGGVTIGHFTRRGEPARVRLDVSGTALILRGGF